MTRFLDWQLRLESFAAARRAVPFTWGVNDCALFAADAVEAMTGVRHLQELRHANVRQALATQRAAGGLAAIASQALGASMPPAFAAVGDVVLLANGKRPALAICNGTSAIGPGPLGMVALPMAQAVAAWRVG
jgi:hypothetical protein